VKERQSVSQTRSGNIRQKDADILEMTDTLERFETVLVRYIRSLEEELAQERRRDDAYAPLTTGLEGMIAMLKNFQHFVDEEVWNRMIAVADRSTSHVHRRTRRFF
jgi:hypothetical protein